MRLKEYPGKNTALGIISRLKSENLGGGLLDVGDQVAPVLLLLETGEDHLCAGDVLLGVLEVDVEGILFPDDAFVNVSLGVSKAGSLSGLSAPNSVKVGSLLVLATGFNSVALGAGLGENLFSVIGAHFFSCRSESSNI